MGINTICGPLISRAEQESAIRQVMQNGTIGTRFFLYGQPVLAYHDACLFSVYTVPSPADQRILEFFRKMGADVSVFEIENGMHSGRNTVKAILTKDLFQRFLHYVGPRTCVTY